MLYKGVLVSRLSSNIVGGVECAVCGVGCAERMSGVHGTRWGWCGVVCAVCVAECTVAGVVAEWGIRCRVCECDITCESGTCSRRIVQGCGVAVVAGYGETTV